MNPVTSFHEFTGRVERSSQNGVKFVEGTPEAPTLFHRVVVLNGDSSPLKPSRSFTIIFSPLFFKYKWRSIDGDKPKTSLEVSTPSGGKSKRKRKRKNRKSRRKT